MGKDRFTEPHNPQPQGLLYGNSASQLDPALTHETLSRPNLRVDAQLQQEGVEHKSPSNAQQPSAQPRQHHDQHHH